jgi:uncharacterized protein (TIGR02145 family)
MKTTKIILSIAAVATLATSVYGACASDIDMGSKKITSLADPTAAQDAATKNYVDAKVTQGGNTVAAPDGYNVIYKGGMAWLDRNVGATVAPTSWNDDTQASLGSLFQWGRPADGHQFRNGATDNNDDDNSVSNGDGGTNDCSTADAPGHSDFILGGNSSGEYNWRTTATDCNTDAKRTHLWSAPGDLVNGVCPAGWRVPSEQDFRSLDIVSAEDAFTKIGLSAAGRRNNFFGTIRNVGVNGYYWTSSVDGGRSRALHIASGSTHFNSYNRAYGCSVRCVKHLVD